MMYHIVPSLGTHLTGKGDMAALELNSAPVGTVAQRAIWWSLQIDSWLCETSYLADIPDEATVVILPSDDPELCNHNLALSRSVEGPQVIIRLDRADDSPNVVTSLYTPIQRNYAYPT